ncbi:MAG: xanthine dehydrogenase family protein molybdopterin-binding subunit, partial [Proteobacteria bacterium]
MSEIKKTTSVGKPISRIDGFLKVTGRATYAAEWQVPDLAHAVLIQSSIAAGEIESFDLREALGVSGVIDILTFENSPKASMPGAGIGTGPGESFVPLQSNEVFYNGQFIGAVVAKTFEAARHAASLVRVRYQEKPSKTSIDDRLSESFEKTRMMGVLKLNKHRGNAEKAFADAPVKIEQKYSTAMVHHAPMEPSAIIAAWNEKQDELRVYDSTQAVADFAKMYSKAFKISLDRTQVIAKFIGGGFGGKGSVWPHQLIAILAAQKTKRPIKLSVTREQMFTAIGYRATTRQTVKLGAERDGTLLSLEHHSLNATAVNNDYVESSAVSTPTLYKVKNWKVRHDLIKVNLQAPTFMRAPGEATGSFALESAMDELAHELKLDPIQLALKNYTDVDNANGRPYTSKSLRACYERGAKEFGWADRTHTPGTRREGDWLIGMGVALAHYPTRLFPAKAEVEVFEDGRVEVRSATQDIGTGTYTIMAQVAAEVLQIPLEQITIKIGDSAFPRSSVSGGSSGAA